MTGHELSISKGNCLASLWLLSPQKTPRRKPDVKVTCHHPHAIQLFKRINVFCSSLRSWPVFPHVPNSRPELVAGEVLKAVAEVSVSKPERRRARKEKRKMTTGRTELASLRVTASGWEPNTGVRPHIHLN